jgi:uncharacterized protein (UPF0210 family)
VVPLRALVQPEGKSHHRIRAARPAHLSKQITDALVVLRRVKSGFESSGYEVQSVRLTTQPLAELVSGLSEEQAMAFLAQLDELSVRENFLPNVGPAMLHDSDDPAAMHLLERVLSTLPNIEASSIIADEAGIHWKTIHRTAELVKYVSEHSPRSQGTLNFTANAMLKPYGPFFPGSYHTGAGGQFAIGFEGANVVRDVFTKDKGNAEAATADLTAALTKHASVARRGQEGGGGNWMDLSGVDPTPAPLGDVSIGAAIKLSRARSSAQWDSHRGTYHYDGGKSRARKQVGYSGLMVPVLEDKVWRNGGPSPLQYRLSARPFGGLRHWLGYDSLPGTSASSRWSACSATSRRSPGNGINLSRRGFNLFRARSRAIEPSSRTRRSLTPRCMPCRNPASGNIALSAIHFRLRAESGDVCGNAAPTRV